MGIASMSNAFVISITICDYRNLTSIMVPFLNIFFSFGNSSTVSLEFVLHLNISNSYSSSIVNSNELKTVTINWSTSSITTLVSSYYYVGNINPPLSLLFLALPCQF